jgi:membrane-associated protease RseP (regulator of RpoE activity)
MPASPFPYEPIYALPRPAQNRVWLHALLFGLALTTTTLVGVDHYAAFLSDFGRHAVVVTTRLLADGLWYSLTIITILGAHEMGHYLACRYYRVDASLPYFLPLPAWPTGTLGAVIRIRQRFPTRRILFDIGVMGPLAGFVVLIPALFIGLHLSTITAYPTGSTMNFGEPLLFQWAARLVFGDVPDGYTLNMHPMVFACWFGMLATAMNLLPFGQLDGGHITYATLGRRARLVSILTFGGTIAMALFVSFGVWGIIAVVMGAMIRLVGLAHPPAVDETEPIGASRTVVALVALAVFIVCVTPTPLDTPPLPELLSQLRAAFLAH